MGWLPKTGLLGTELTLSPGLLAQHTLPAAPLHDASEPLTRSFLDSSKARAKPGKTETPRRDHYKTGHLRGNSARPCALRAD